MFLIKSLPEFTKWLNDLPDKLVRSTIIARIKRLEFGLMGDVKYVGNGVSELRINLGAGWRLYFTQRGKQVIVLLIGGSKRTQRADIKRAQILAGLLENEGNDDDQTT